MERFIESRNYVYQFLCEYLKSSMERFIVGNKIPLSSIEEI